VADTERIGGGTAGRPTDGPAQADSVAGQGGEDGERGGEADEASGSPAAGSPAAGSPAVGTPSAGSSATGSSASGSSASGSPGSPGSPASEPAADGSDTAPAPRGRRKIGVLLAVAACVYLLDLVTKIAVVTQLEPDNESIDVVGDLLRFQVIRNAGAAFGIGQSMTLVFTLIAVIVIVVIARLARKLYSLPWAIALGLLLGGPLGNLTDRVFRSPGFLKGHVVDFIAPAHFAVFNLADSAIVCGGVLIVLLSFRGLDPDGTVHRD
jgi:signal peptidase II